MGRRALSDDQADYLTEHWGEKTPETWAEFFGVSRATVFNTRRRRVSTDPELGGIVRAGISAVDAGVTDAAASVQVDGRWYTITVTAGEGH